MPMLLVNQSGQQLEIEASAWSELLHLAVLHGWTPRGTAPPPVDFDSGRRDRWAGSYDEGAGQMVSRDDAAGLALAVSEAGLDPDSFRHFGENELERAVSFLRSGPFLLTGEAGTSTEGQLPFDHQLMSLDAVLRDAAEEYVS
jgi:hypothetical protein